MYEHRVLFHKKLVSIMKKEKELQNQINELNEKFNELQNAFNKVCIILKNSLKVASGKRCTLTEKKLPPIENQLIFAQTDETHFTILFDNADKKRLVFDNNTTKL